MNFRFEIIRSPRIAYPGKSEHCLASGPINYRLVSTYLYVQVNKMSVQSGTYIGPKTKRINQQRFHLTWSMSQLSFCLYHRPVIQRRLDNGFKQKHRCFQYAAHSLVPIHLSSDGQRLGLAGERVGLFVASPAEVRHLVVLLSGALSPRQADHFPDAGRLACLQWSRVSASRTRAVVDKRPISVLMRTESDCSVGRHLLNSKHSTVAIDYLRRTSAVAFVRRTTSTEEWCARSADRTTGLVRGQRMYRRVHGFTEMPSGRTAWIRK